ncbi:acyltransferase family protein [Polynucleobacter rarus]|uniref:acyltransferase family protein n=1 Tax=Polynucleobacter rarus TaxID=556055 RepID=UPI000D3E0614
MGVCVAELYKDKKRLKSNNQLILILGTLISILTFYSLGYNDTIFTRLIFGFGIALVLLGLVLQNEIKINGLTLPLILLGNASFSIYLIHNPLLSMTQRLARDIGLTWYYSLCFGVVISIFIGFLYHRLYEVPMLRFLHKKIRNQ